MPKSLIPALLAGLLASGLFLAVFGAGLGFMFMFLPALPLFFLALSAHATADKYIVPIALAVATFIIGLAGGPASGALFLIFLGLPCWYFAKKSLLHLPAAPGMPMFWYPLGLIVLNLTLWACALVAMMVWYYSDLPGGMPQLLAQNIRDAFSDLKGEYGDVVENMATGWSFLIFPITIWLWGMLLYAHAWIANRALARGHKQLRPGMEVAPFIIPGWMLTLLAICALATLIGGPSMSFLGKSSLLSLLLPYFFLGASLMHRYFRKWPSSRFFLFFVYFLIFTQFWPFLILAGIGLWHQIKYLLAAGGWSRS